MRRTKEQQRTSKSLNLKKHATFVVLLMSNRCSANVTANQICNSRSKLSPVISLKYGMLTNSDFGAFNTNASNIFTQLLTMRGWSKQDLHTHQAHLVSATKSGCPPNFVTINIYSTELAAKSDEGSAILLSSIVTCVTLDAFRRAYPNNIH